MPQPTRGSQVSIATWNMLFRSAPMQTLEYLDAAPWDIACLQEVNAHTSAELAKREDWDLVDGLQLAREELRSWRRPHGVAIVARNEWRLDGGDVIAGTPTPGRGVKARARRGEDRLSVMSWHAPNKASEGLGTKMAGYRAVVDAINGTEGSLVVGLDSNHWSLETDLDLPEHDPDHPHAIENQFFSRRPQHRLADALILYLRANPDAYREVLRRRPDGPLEVTYKRGKTADRFDYIMVSEDVDVIDITHDFAGATRAGSDHGFVSARLGLGARG